jgi:hypothetical protein
MAANKQNKSPKSEKLAAALKKNLQRRKISNKMKEKNNKPLQKLACEDEMLGDLGAEPQVVLNIHEDSSTNRAQQFASQVEFPKRSNQTGS